MKSAIAFYFPISLLALGMAFSTAAADLELAPPSFINNKNTYVPIDILESRATLVLNAKNQTAETVALLRFSTKEDGRPYLRFAQRPLSVTLDHSAVTLDELPSPFPRVKVRALSVPVKAATIHEVEIKYSLTSSVSFENGGAGLGFFMSDLNPVNFLEQFLPANFEFDSFPLSLDVSIVGSTVQHRVFTNGKTTLKSAQQWLIEFPAYFVSSSHYFHVTAKPLAVAQGEFAGLEKKIPITTYGGAQSLADEALSASQKVLAELEATFGAYAHDSLTVYVTPEGGGMEYCGATMTSLWALEHEITHSWFARGVMPSDGDAGWMDEAIASWRDDGYQTSMEEPMRAKLSAFSPFNIATPTASYNEGENFLRYLDHLTHDTGGLKPALKEWFTLKKRRAVSTGQFEDFLSQFTRRDLRPEFGKFVYGAVGVGKSDFTGSTPLGRKHPRKYTAEELRRYQ